MQKIQISYRSYNIEDIHRLIKNKIVTIQPKFQRRRTKWPLTAKTGLIDSILNNFPIPPIYVREFVNNAKERRREIIDGQQRITTIYEFLSDEWKLSKNLTDDEYVGYSFSELPNEVQQQINDYELTFLHIRGASESDIISIFSRINSYSLPLNLQEKRNAKYSGEFKSLVYDLSSKYYSFWTDNRIITSASIARMKDAELVSELLTIMKHGLKGHTKKRIEDLYKKYDESSFPEKDDFVYQFDTIISNIGTLFNSSEKIKKQFSKSAFFFPLFTALHKKLFRIKSRKKSISLDETIVKLDKFISDYSNTDSKNKLKLLFQQGTGETSSKIKREDLIYDLIS